MLDKTVDQEKRLDAARADLETIVDALIATAEDEKSASTSSESYAQWRADRESLTVERQRLAILVKTLEQEIADNSAAEAAAMTRLRHGEKKKLNAALAKRIRSDLAKANAILLPLLRDVAASALEDQQINARLPDDLPALVGADYLARSREALQRKVVKTEQVSLWIKQGTDFLLGDQSAIEDLGGGFGIYRTATLINCTRATFNKISFHPPLPEERPVPLLTMKIPNPDGPGLIFDGSRFTDPRSAVAALDRPSAPQERAIEFELARVPDFRSDPEVESELTSPSADADAK